GSGAPTRSCRSESTGGLPPSPRRLGAGCGAAQSREAQRRVPREELAQPLLDDRRLGQVGVIALSKLEQLGVQIQRGSRRLHESSITICMLPVSPLSAAAPPSRRRRPRASRRGG